jgi:subtilisin family serine protease
LTEFPNDPNALIAILDTGVLANHPLLQGCIREVVDFTGEGGEDRNGHGTSAALLARVMIPGMPRGRFLILKVAGADGRGAQDNLLRALGWMREFNRHGETRIMTASISLGVYNRKWLVRSLMAAARYATRRRRRRRGYPSSSPQATCRERPPAQRARHSCLRSRTSSLAVLSLTPAQDIVRTGLPGRVEHFVAYAGSAAIAMAGYGATRGATQIIGGFWVYAGILDYLQHFSPGRQQRSGISRRRRWERCAAVSCSRLSGRVCPLSPWYGITNVAAPQRGAPTEAERQGRGALSLLTPC